MKEQAVAIFCICDEVSKYLDLKDDPQCKMSTSELMTFAILAATYFQADYKKTRLMSLHLNFFDKILSSSRIIRRIHAIQQETWMIVLYVLRIYLQKCDSEYFIVDSFPVSAYQTHKSFRAKIFKGKVYHGYTASKKMYFFGLKIHMIVNSQGVPIEFCITPGSVADVEGLKLLPCELPEHSILIGDRAYTNYSLEDDLLEMMNIKLCPKRRKNLTRQHTAIQEFIHSKKRNLIETVFSVIVSKMPRQIKARTEQGFILKIIFFILAYSMGLYLNRELSL
jgi:predicted ABC-type ATPase